MSKFKNISWESAIFLIGYQLLLVGILPVYFYFCGAPSLLTIGLSILTLFATGLSITVGYHRLFSHQTFKTNRVIEAIMLFFGSMSTQSSALTWAFLHRLHHAHIDKDDDPYNVQKGFWHAHFLWMMKKTKPIENKIVSDLLRNPLIRFQHKYYNLCMIFSNLIYTMLMGWITGDYFSAFVFTWGVRLFFLHHFTWFINSLAHYWGHQNYSTEHSAMDNYILCFLTFGEGYHNYHHTYANDYRNGIRWYHFDPSKWLIWTLSKLKLAHGLRRSNEARVLGMMVEEHKRKLLEKLTKSISSKKEELEEKVVEFTDSLSETLQSYQKVLAQYRAGRKSFGRFTKHIRPISKELTKLKRSVKKELRAWRKLSKSVMRLKTAA